MWTEGVQQVEDVPALVGRSAPRSVAMTAGSRGRTVTGQHLLSARLGRQLAVAL